ncbi:MAG TPA: hypothetical protein VGE50_09770 [Gammaproteobacteria bacterium]
MMLTKRVMVMAVASLLVACSCNQPKPAAPPPAAVAPAAAASSLTKEAEQVIALAEKEPATPAADPAAPPAPLPEGALRCWLKGDVRTIATEQGKDGSCQVVYDSAGQNHVVANKSRDLAECTRLQERLKKNLIASGFTCE